MRAFIIGNGRSLTVSDLDKLTGLPSYACNRINLVYPETFWRPTVYTHIESLAPDMPYIQENIDLGIECWIGEHYAEPPRGKMYLKDAPNIHFIKDCHHHLNKFSDEDTLDEWHLPQPCSFGGSVNFMMQLAVIHGFSELVLLGCDLEYRDRKQSHFDKAYEHGGEQPAFFASRNALFGHIQAMNYIRRFKKNVTVINATRGGLLELWPRKTLDEVLNG